MRTIFGSSFGQEDPAGLRPPLVQRPAMRLAVGSILLALVLLTRTFASL